MVVYEVAIGELKLLVLRQDLQRASHSQDAAKVLGQGGVGELSDHETDLECLVEVCPAHAIVLEFMEVGVRVQLDKLKVSRVDDGFVAGSADEPYLWLIVAKVDGTTIFENSPATATVAVQSTSAAPGNLGPASQGVEAGTTIAIPKSVGRIDTTLRGTTGGVLTLSGSGAFTRGTITSGINPLNGKAIDGEPADNITPVKLVGSARFTEPGGH